MKAKLLEIYWHEKQPIYALCSNPTYKFASAGADNAIRVVHLSSLHKHAKAVNAISFHPKGFSMTPTYHCLENILASAGDGISMSIILGALLILWSLQTSSLSASSVSSNSDLLPSSPEGTDQNGPENQETWNPIVISRIADSEDIYDLKWSSCGNFIILALTNNTAVVWCHSTGKILKILRDHSHFVQGVAPDPLGLLFATQSSDRSVKIYSYENDKKFSVKYMHTLSRIPSNQGLEITSKIGYVKIFNDETLVTFFRRLSFSPDGSLLAVPCGIISDQTSHLARRQHSCLFLYTRASLLSLAQHPPIPSIVLGPFDKAPVVVCFHPNLFQLMDKDSLISLPYAMVFAVGTQDSVFIYRTDRNAPLVALNGMHFANITGLCWTKPSIGGPIILVISSTDGFCSSMVFENDELGTLYSYNQENHTAELGPCISAEEVVKALASSISRGSLEDEMKALIPIEGEII